MDRKLNPPRGVVPEGMAATSSIQFDGTGGAFVVGSSMPSIQQQWDPSTAPGAMDTPPHRRNRSESEGIVPSLTLKSLTTETPIGLEAAARIRQAAAATAAFNSGRTGTFDDLPPTSYDVEVEDASVTDLTAMD
jgi:hypothetical protein